LFKALKQSLKIKTFVGTSENAVQIQIWTVLSVDPAVAQLRTADRLVPAERAGVHVADVGAR